MKPPLILLVSPQMGENIGATARAMANFGCTELRLVNPRDGWPNPKAIEMAAHAVAIVEQARVFDSLRDALADVEYATAVTARLRDMEKETLVPEQLFNHTVEYVRDEVSPPPSGGRVREGVLATYRHDSPLSLSLSPQGRGDDNRFVLQSNGIHQDRKRYQTMALVFGPERSGLTNEDITLCDSITTIPVNPAHPSLNLAQAVAVMCYEWFKSGTSRTSEARSGTSFNNPPSSRGLTAGSQEAGVTGTEGETALASKAELYNLFERVETLLDERNFYRVPEKREHMVMQVRNILHKAQLTSQEIGIVHGILTALAK